MKSFEEDYTTQKRFAVKTPLAQSILHGDSFETMRFMRTDPEIAHSIFVHGSTADSLLCTLPFSQQPQSSVVEFFAVSTPQNSVVEEIDLLESKYIHKLLQEQDSKQKFRFGDLVKLAPGRRCSSCVEASSSLLQSSERCLGDWSWGRIGIINWLKDGVANVTELVDSVTCDYSPHDLVFADDSYSCEVVPSPPPTYFAEDPDMTVKLTRADVSVSSESFGRGCNCLIDDDLSTYWQTSTTSEHWITVSVPLDSFQSLEMYVANHEENSPSKMIVLAGATLTTLKRVKIISDLPSNPQWFTLLDNAEAFAEDVTSVKIIKLASIVTKAAAVPLTVTCLRLHTTRPLPAPLEVGERVALSDTFDENRGDGWCLGDKSNRKVGVVLSAPKVVGSLGEEQRGILVVNEEDGKFGLFKGSWLQRAPLSTDFKVGDRVQLSRAFAVTQSTVDTHAKCLEVLSAFGEVVSVGSLCNGVRRNIEVQVRGEDGDRSSLYWAPSLQLASRQFAFVDREDAHRLGSIFSDVYGGPTNYEFVLNKFGLQAWSKLCAGRREVDLSKAILCFERWRALCHELQWQSGKPTLSTPPKPIFHLLCGPNGEVCEAAKAGGSQSDQGVSSHPLGWDCSSCNTPNPWASSACEICQENAPAAVREKKKKSYRLELSNYKRLQVVRVALKVYN